MVSAVKKEKAPRGRGEGEGTESSCILSRLICLPSSQPCRSLGGSEHPRQQEPRAKALRQEHVRHLQGVVRSPGARGRQAQAEGREVSPAPGVTLRRCEDFQSHPAGTCAAPGLCTEEHVSCLVTTSVWAWAGRGQKQEAGRTGRKLLWEGRGRPWRPRPGGAGGGEKASRSGI